MQDKKFSLIEFFISHRLAANLLIAIFILLGMISLAQLNTRFLPKFSLDTVVVSVVWPGASPADVESALTTPIEKQLASLDDVLRMSSVSSRGLSMIIVEFNRGANMTRASQEIRDQVNLVPNWPERVSRQRYRWFNCMTQLLMSSSLLRTIHVPCVIGRSKRSLNCWRGA